MDSSRGTVNQEALSLIFPRVIRIPILMHVSSQIHSGAVPVKFRHKGVLTRPTNIFPVSAVPRYMGEEIYAAPQKLPVRPAGMEDLEGLLDRTPIMKPVDLENGDATPEPSSELPPQPIVTAKPESVILPTHATSLKNTVKWVHPHPQVQ